MAESPSELQAEIEKLERKHADNPEGRYFVPLANAYRKLGAVEHAEALLRAGLQKHPEYLSAHIVLGRCLADRQAMSEAAEEFRYVLSLDPQNLIALRTLGELAWSEGKTDEAGGWYQQLLTVDPMNEEARRALEGLRMPVAPADPEEEFHAGRGWWQRPEEEAERPTEAEAEAEPEPFAGPADVAPPEEPLPELRGRVPEDEDAGFLLSYQAFSDPDEPAAVRAEPAPAPFDPFAAGEIELDGGFADEPEPSGEPDTGEDEVVTETIAELYLRQGFHDRAADVYRELIRRRGGDAALERRLAELEGRGPEVEPDATAEREGPSAPEPAPEIDSAPRVEPALEPVNAEWEEPVLTPLEPWDAAGAAPLPSLDDYGTLPAEEEPEAEAEAEEDAFAASFSTGFTADPELLQAVVGDAPAGPSIRDVLAELLAWSAAAAEPLAEPETPFSEALAPMESEEEEDSLGLLPGAGGFGGLDAEAEPAFGSGRAESEPAGSGTGSADESLFPWEEEPSSGELPGGWSPAAAEPVDSGFSFEDFRSDEPAEPAVPDAPPEAPAAASPDPEPAAPAAEEDDDLESFQAWLRSLKR